MKPFHTGQKSLVQMAVPHSNTKGPKKSLLLIRNALWCHRRQPLMKGRGKKIIPQEIKPPPSAKRSFSKSTTAVSAVATALEIRISAC